MTPYSSAPATAYPNSVGGAGFASRPTATGQQNTLRSAMLAQPMRRIGLLFLYVLIFIRFGQIHEYTTYLLHTNTFLLLLVGPPAVLFALMSGGLRRVFQSKSSAMWMFLSVWLLIVFPFSSWRGGSIEIVNNWWRTIVPMFIACAGLILTWSEVRKAMFALALGGGVSALISFTARGTSGDRLALNFGSLGNSNDIAAHMMLAVPFLIYALTRKKIFLLLALPALAIISYFIAGSGSRGAMVSAGVSLLIALRYARGGQRIGILALFLAGGTVGALLAPSTALERLTSMFNDRGTASQLEAEMSKQTRTELLKRSIEVAIRNPLVGVGPGQFMNYEGKISRIEQGKRGLWYGAHNSYTNMAAEAGLLGLILFAGAILASILECWRMLRLVRGRPGFEDAEAVMFYMLIAIGGMAVSIFFLNFAYTYYMPMLGSLGAAFAYVLRQDLAAGVLSDGARRAVAPSSAPSSVPGRDPSGIPSGSPWLGGRPATAQPAAQPAPPSPPPPGPRYKFGRLA